MLSYTQSAAVIFAAVLAVSIMLRIIDRSLDKDLRSRTCGVNGWQLSILGSIYAVALGFMLSDSWIAFQTAGSDARAEAAASLTVYRLAPLLPAACAGQVQDAARNYVATVADREWPAMAQSKPDWTGDAILHTIWQTIVSCRVSPGTPDERHAVLASLQTLQLQRDARTQDYAGHLPIMMWLVLLFGGLAVVVASCLLGNESPWIHRVHVVCLTILVSTILLAIADLDQPFNGATHVDESAFRTAANAMR